MKDKLSPKNIFLLLQLLFGLYFVLHNPLFQGPDEINHFYRTYAISTGQLEPEINSNRRGGLVPLSFKAVADTFAHLRWYPNRKVSPNRIKALHQRPIQPDQVVFVDYPNTALYPALVYIPHAGVMSFARWLDLPVVVCLRLLRLTSVLIGLFAGWLILSLLF